MKVGILLLLLIGTLISYLNDDNSNEVEPTKIAAIIDDITSESNTLKDQSVTIKGFLRFSYSVNTITEACEYPYPDFTCNYESSDAYLAQDTHTTNNEYLISDTKNNYDLALNLSFASVNEIDSNTYSPDYKGVFLNNYPITISGELKYTTANNPDLLLKQKRASIVIDKKSINRLNEIFKDLLIVSQ